MDNTHNPRLIGRVAITPAAFDNTCVEGNSVAIELVELLGRILGSGLVADLRQGELYKSIGDRLRRFKDIGLRDKLTGLLRVLKDRNRFFLQPSADAEFHGWLFEAIAVSPPLDLIVTTDVDTQDFVTMRPASVLPNYAIPIASAAAHPCWQQSSLAVRRKADDFEKVLQPILRNAESILLIDPYICSDPRFLTPLTRLIKSSFTRSDPSTLSKFEVHARAWKRKDDKSKSEKDRFIDRVVLGTYQSEFRRKLTSSIPKGRKVVFKWWGEKDNGQDFHNRFVLSNLSLGVAIGQGLEDSNAESYDDWHLLTDYATIWGRFRNQQSGPYEFAASFEVPGK